MSYINNQLVECMRSNSIEKKSENAENVAMFTNRLNQTMKLNVGDKVSIERAFINGLGAGNENTIQFSGKKVKPKYNKKQIYTIIKKNNYQALSQNVPYRMGYYLGYEVEEEETEPLDIKDNEASIIVGYYINSSNHPSYIQLPRRFSSRYHGTSTSNGDWIENDSADAGLPLANNSVDPYSFCYADWKYFQSGDGAFLKQRVDNSRFTIYLREAVYYAWEITDNTQSPPATIPIHGRSVQSHIPYMTSWAKYFRYRERKIVKVDKGFNAPQSVANQIKEQLNQSEESETFEISDDINKQIKHPLTTTMSAETYKPFNVANVNDFSSLGWDDFSRFDTIPTNNLIMQYEAQFWAVGVKRPEIWDAGRDYVGDDFENGIWSIGRTIDIGTRNNVLIYMEVEWTDPYLEYLRNIFEAQKLYTELWDDLDKLKDYEELTQAQLDLINPNESAFLHMARYGTADAPEDLTKVPISIDFFGQDGLGRSASNPSTTGTTATAPLFINYNQEQKDYYVNKALFTPDIENNWNISNKVYGYFIPWYNNGKYYIAVQSKGLIPKLFFNGTTPAEGGNPAIPQSKIWGSADLFVEESGRQIGYDFSWTAYGTACCLPYSPHTERSFEGQGVSHGGAHYISAVRNATDQGNIPTIQYLTQAYLGANNPKMEYNTETNRFEFSQLHTAENLGNNWDAGDMGSGKVVGEPINPNAGDIVYKINPRVGYDGYAPTFKPYNNDALIQFADPDGANTLPDMIEWENDATHPTEAQLKLGKELNQRDISLSNPNIEPYRIFDSWGGIYFDDMGYNIEEWEENSLWGRLGFSWEQFNSQPSSNNILNQRISEDNRYDLYRATTNAIVDTTDTKAFYVNLYGAPLYSTAIGSAVEIQSRVWQIPPTGAIYPRCSFTAGPSYTYYPAMTQSTSSLTLPARNLPKIQLNPFYTIRSNIIGYTDYLGAESGGARLNVLGVIDRYGAQGDFFYGSPSDITFSITKQTILSDIETAICNPDGSFAQVDADCGVIYRVQKQMPAPQNIIEEIMEEQEKEK